MNTEEFVIKQYSRPDSLESYREITKKGLWQEEESVFKKYISGTETILDLGCGTGRVAYNLKAGGEVYACDIVPAMIDVAHELSVDFNTKPIFSVQDGKKLSYKDASFDVVIFAYNGINTVPDKANRQAIMNEVYRVLNPNGTIILASHVRNFRNKPLMWTKRYLQAALRLSKTIKEYGDNINFKYGRAQYINIPSLKETHELISKSGFKLVESLPTDTNSTNDNYVLPPRNTWIFVGKKE